MKSLPPPAHPECIEAIRKACAGGASSLLIVLNHAGDVFSANIALAAVLREGLKVEMVLTHEDIAGGPKLEDRRGLVGFLPVYKVAGAAAEQGLPLRLFSKRMQGASMRRPVGVKWILLFLR